MKVKTFQKKYFGSKMLLLFEEMYLLKTYDVILTKNIRQKKVVCLNDKMLYRKSFSSKTN